MQRTSGGTSATRRYWRDPLLLLLATLWGSSYAFIKLGVATIPPVTLIAARTAIAGALLLGLLHLRGLQLPRERRYWGRFFIQALLNSVVPFTLIAWAERALDASGSTFVAFKADHLEDSTFYTITATRQASTYLFHYVGSFPAVGTWAQKVLHPAVSSNNDIY